MCENRADSALLIVCLDLVLLTTMLEAHELRDAEAPDEKGTCLHTNIDELVVLKYIHE